MIDPTYLASLRRLYSSEYLLLLVQLELLSPPFWRETQRLLAQDLGVHRSNLNRALQFLQRRELIRYVTRSGAPGIWIWWVKTSEADRPNLANQPCWTLARLDNSGRLRVPVDASEQWAADRGVTREAMRRFLAGRQRTLGGRWRLVAGPIDAEEVA